VLQYHPGLEFLADTPEFQARYAETVIYRIFYTINRCAARRAHRMQHRDASCLLNVLLSSVYNILSGSICGIGCGQHHVQKLHSDMEHLTPALLANLS
jgi:hypothetical protein